VDLAVRQIMDRVGGRLILACFFERISSQTHIRIKVAFGAQA
jgi:hypothetical protein